jgi:hypothetical protein
MMKIRLTWADAPTKEEQHQAAMEINYLAWLVRRRIRWGKVEG